MTALDQEAWFDGRERAESQLPAAALLARLGWKTLTSEEALKLRGGKLSRVLLTDVLHAQLDRMNRIHFRGEEHRFTPVNLRRAIQALEDVPLAAGAQRANEQVYDLLRLGRSLEQTVAGDTKSFTLRYIDWNTPENNVFHVTTEYTLLRAGSRQTCRPDVVLFVNGIPFVIIECKAPDTPLDKALTQILNYQKPDQVPELFKYVQLVLAVRPDAAKYATAGTPKEFWALWREEGMAQADAEIEAHLRTSLPDRELEALSISFVREQPQLYAAEEAGRLVTEQDRTVYALCRPERLLELASRFIVYHRGEKKIARYQQYFAVKKTMRRILSDEGKGSRPSGVLWHTQGSGKSLTMVMIVNAIAQTPGIANPRIVLVTDRVDLDKQLGETFHHCGLEAQRATSGADLRRRIESPRATVITTLVHKFAAAMEHGVVADESRDIFVLVDESHRTQYGPLNEKMRAVFPNACYLAFTGTPLTRAEKSTFLKFGALLHSYTMEQAVADGAVVPLLYERRHVPQDVNGPALDLWFERLSAGLTQEQQGKLKRKFSRRQAVSRTEQRLREIAFDVWNHYRANWQKEGRYKAQLVAPDKKSALRLRTFLEDLNGEGEDAPRVVPAVVISPPDLREGEEDADAQDDADVMRFWKETVEKRGGEEKYEEAVIADFRSASEPDILIVVDKLLTGFDAPRNTVLYLARRLRSHTLLQAVARVNRLNEGKDFGFIIDYEGVLGDLDRALNEYRALGDFDADDLREYLDSVRVAVEGLEQKRAALLDVFREVRNKHDLEEYAKLLYHPERRNDFFETFNEYAKALHTAVASELFYERYTKTEIDTFREDLDRFRRLRAIVQARYADIRSLEPQIEKLLNTFVSAGPTQVFTPEPVNIFDAAAMEKALADLHTQLKDTKKDIKTDAAQADLMAHATKRVLQERMDEDPAFYRKFSELIQETIDAFHHEALTDADYLARIRGLHAQVVTHADENVPERLIGNDIAQAYYRIVQERLTSLGGSPNDQELAADIALMVDKATRTRHVVDWQHKQDVQNRMRADIDDGFFLLSEAGRIALNWEALDEIAAEAFRVAKSRLP